jgi:phage terminase small subunit
MLTAKQENFAQAIADGMSQSDAYRSAFNAEKMKPETIWARASELMADGKVAGRVKELRERLTEKTLWTREKSVRALEKVLEEGPHAAQVSAVKELNLMHGFNEPIKIDHTSSDGSMTPRQPIYKIVSE